MIPGWYFPFSCYPPKHCLAKNAHLLPHGVCSTDLTRPQWSMAGPLTILNLGWGDLVNGTVTRRDKTILGKLHKLHDILLWKWLSKLSTVNRLVANNS